MVPDHTLLVVPADPDVKELQAALNVMSGFGSLVGDKFDFNLVSAGELTNDTLAANNLIFVGRPDEFDMLSNIKFPLAINSKKFVSLPASHRRMESLRWQFHLGMIAKWHC